MKSLTECRAEIDEIDSQLLELLVRRIGVAESVARYKLANNMQVFDSTREAAVLEKIGARSPEDVRAEIVGTWDGIMNMSKLHQYRIKSEFSEKRDFLSSALTTEPPKAELIGVQGCEGAFAEKAARVMYPDADIRFFPHWADIFTALREGSIDRGVLPVENSTYGSVSDVYRLMIGTDAYIDRAVRLGINHALLVKPGTTLADIREVTSHPQAIGQCAEYIRAHGFKAVNAANTAVAARSVADSERRDVAAIAASDCAERYGLVPLELGIQDEKCNTTRFASVSPRLTISPDADRVSVRFSLEHRDGTLSRLLGYFAALGLNLTKIESSPIPDKPFEYRFFLDFDGTLHDTHTFELICALSDELSDFRLMGNYRENEA